MKIDTCDPDRFAETAPGEVVVTQAARDAAADLLDARRGYAVGGAIRRGENDRGHSVQAFARFERDITRAADERIAGLVETLRGIDTLCPPETGGMSSGALAGLLYCIETRVRAALATATDSKEGEPPSRWNEIQAALETRIADQPETDL